MQAEAASRLWLIQASALMNSIEAISYSLAAALSLPVAAAYIAVIFQWREIPLHKTAMRLVSAACLLGAVYWSAQACYGMFALAYQLTHALDGPGPFGLLIFPFIAAGALLPAAIGMVVLWQANKRA